jgi:hypothetical protein
MKSDKTHKPVCKWCYCKEKDLPLPPEPVAGSKIGYYKWCSLQSICVNGVIILQEQLEGLPVSPKAVAGIKIYNLLKTLYLNSM